MATPDICSVPIRPTMMLSSRLTKTCLIRAESPTSGTEISVGATSVYDTSESDVATVTVGTVTPSEPSTEG